MLDLGWWELAIVGLLMILVLGPKELPHAMRTIARFMRKARRLASEFQGHMDELIREAELDEVRSTIRSIKNKDVGAAINQAVDPTGEFTKELDDTLSDAKRELSEPPDAPEKPAEAPAQKAAENSEEPTTSNPDDASKSVPSSSA